MTTHYKTTNASDSKRIFYKDKQEKTRCKNFSKATITLRVRGTNDSVTFEYTSNKVFRDSRVNHTVSRDYVKNEMIRMLGTTEGIVKFRKLMSDCDWA